MAISTIPDQPAKSANQNSQLFKEMDRHKRWSCWQWFGCLFVLVIIAIIAGVLWLVAALGLVKIPGVSQFAFPANPAPARIVSPLPFDSAALQKNAVIAPDGSGGTIVVSEGQLTSIVSADHFPLFRQAQVMIDPDGLRIFGLYVGQSSLPPIAISAHLVPATATHPTCTVDELKVGYLPIPAQLLRTIVNKNCQSLTSILALAGPGQPNQVEFGQGQLTLHLAPETSQSKQ